MTATIHPLPRKHPYVRFQYRLRIIRIEYGREQGINLSQDDFADLLGIKRGTYAGYEADATPRDLISFCQKVEQVTGYDAGWLAGLADSPNTPPDQGGRLSGCIDGGPDAAILPFRLVHDEAA